MAPVTGAWPGGPIGELPDVPIDIVGDVHGHLEPLQRLLDRLGYAADGRHPDGRRLVFIGDLGDRGPDSPGVFELVMQAVAAGRAVCVLGNHELPFLDAEDEPRRKPGNAWFFDDDPEAGARDAAIFGPFTRAMPAQRQRIAAFCDTLPVVVRHPRLRLVHACWDEASIGFIRDLGTASNRVIAAACAARAAALLAASGLTERYRAAREALAERRQMRDWRPDLAIEPGEQQLIADLIAGEEVEQTGNPLRLLTSGLEAPAPVPRWLGRKWRFLERRPWWEQRPPSHPTVIGHYWRQRRHLPMQPYDEHRALFGASAAHDWLGRERRTMCVDYRWPEDWNRPALAALRPDLGELVFWDDERVASLAGGREG